MGLFHSLIYYLQIVEETEKKRYQLLLSEEILTVDILHAFIFLYLYK